MPRTVDETQRRGEIGWAALSIAMSKGIDAVTFRAVAAEIGARSTTAVTHYAATRTEVLQLLLETLYGASQQAIDSGPRPEDPRVALAVLIEAVLPTDPLTLGVARVALDASLQIAGRLTNHEELDRWGAWLYEHVENLVTEIAGSDSKATADALIAMITGVSLSTLIDGAYWTPDRQRAAAQAALSAHGLSSNGE